MALKGNLQLGADVVLRILPHRRPFLMVDAVQDYDPGPPPALRASRSISANEPVFEGHFPGLHLWPGVHTIEGLGQTANLLLVIGSLREGWRAHGRDPDEVLAALKNLEQGYRLSPGYAPEASAALVEVLGDGPAAAASRIGLSAAVDVKLLAPVFAGQRLDYCVRQTHEIGELVRFEVEARVADKLVARGTMTSSRSVPAPPFPRGRP